MKIAWSTLAGFLAGVASTTVAVGQTAPGYVVQPYAHVTDPVRMSFASDGALFVGRDHMGSGGGAFDAVSIHRVAPGGATVATYGASLYDPDAVIVDVLGAVSGTAGSVLVGGSASMGWGAGLISAILPGGTVVQSACGGASTDFVNPDKMLFDHAGRLVFTDYNDVGGGTVRVGTASTTSMLLQMPAGVLPDGLAIDGWNHLFVAGSDGVIRTYDSAGSLIDDTFAVGVNTQALAFANGGAFGADLYAITYGGDLLRLDSSGNSTVIGSGFSSTMDIAFGADHALYVSDFDNDRILVVAPEPAGLALLAAGGLALLGRRRRPETGRLRGPTGVCPRTGPFRCRNLGDPQR